MATEWSIQQLARAVGTTSRTLRHYGDVGLLAPSRVGANGLRFYDARSLVRLQRILLLRGLGVGIPAIADALAGQADDANALRTHLRALEREKSRLDRQIASVERTITSLERGEPLMPEQSFDGFDHTAYRKEVTERWGREAYATGDTWWRSLSRAQQRAFQAEHRQIAADYAAARESAMATDSAAVQAIVARHVAWLEQSSGPVSPERLGGLASMYVGDPRFAKSYGGVAGADYVRDAIVSSLAG